uniref:Uncharacterized protein n=1 Tax=Candidatus Kentrum sp. TC TaxID=2126339 RepID=A0A450ZTA9_9GAMM|nr:MAG: hypothetical protein BECKTC1821F_GA0114240_101411 [Candidatus Kentron sp. TC]
MDSREWFLKTKWLEQNSTAEKMRDRPFRHAMAPGYRTNHILFRFSKCMSMRRGKINQWAIFPFSENSFAVVDNYERFLSRRTPTRRSRNQKRSRSIIGKVVR